MHITDVAAGDNGQGQASRRVGPGLCWFFSYCTCLSAPSSSAGPAATAEPPDPSSPSPRLSGFPFSWEFCALPSDLSEGSQRGYHPFTSSFERFVLEAGLFHLRGCCRLSCPLRGPFHSLSKPRVSVLTRQEPLVLSLFSLLMQKCSCLGFWRARALGFCRGHCLTGQIPEPSLQDRGPHCHLLLRVWAADRSQGSLSWTSKAASSGWWPLPGAAESNHRSLWGYQGQAPCPSSRVPCKIS